MTQQEKLVEKIAEWCWKIPGLDLPFPSFHGYDFKDVPKSHSGKKKAYEMAHSLISTVLIPAGCVMLDEDQALPYAWGASTYGTAQRDMIDAGFRRVLPLAPEGKK